MNKKILVIDAHPDAHSFGQAMAGEYVKGAKESGHSVVRLNIRDLGFDPVLHYGYREEQPLEPDLLAAQDKIRSADHLVITTPVWWGGLPGLFKGFVDRTFIRGFSHRFDPNKKLPIGLLKGRSVSVIYSQGGPKIYSLLNNRDSFWVGFKTYILKFCGLKPIKRKCFDKVKSGSDKDRKHILDEVLRLGQAGF